MAESVMDNTGSAIPETIAGRASCWIRLNEILMGAAFIKPTKLRNPSEAHRNFLGGFFVRQHHKIDYLSLKIAHFRFDTNFGVSFQGT